MSEFSSSEYPVLESPANTLGSGPLVLGVSALMLMLGVQQALGQIAQTEEVGVGASETTAEARSLEEVLVYGRAKEFYLQQKTSVGSKLDLDVLDLPQSAQILTEQLMLDQAARDTTDLYRSIAGVSEFSYSGVTFRGFRDDQNVFYDGVRGDAYFGFSVPQLFNVERLEVLKGPSAALYGGGEPGGMLNYVTKKPQFERFNELTVTGGNYDLMGFSVDSRGAATEQVAYRLAGFYEEEDSFRDNADEMNMQLAGGLLLQPNDATRFTGTFEYVEQDLGGHRLRGVPATDDGDFIVGRAFNTNEAFDYQTLEALVLQGVLEHRFTESFRVSTTARYLVDSDREQAYHEPRGWVDANGDGEANVEDGVIARQYRDQFRSDEAFSLTTDFFYNFEWAGVPHQFLFGADLFSVESSFDFLVATGESAGVLNLNVFQPAYGVTDPSSYNLIELPVSEGERLRYGIYVQDYVELGEHWGVMFGARYDFFEDKDQGSGFSFSDDNVAPRLGLIYQPVDGASLYLNYSESFQPSSLASQEDVEGEGNLDPETGVQYEVGWKQEWLDGGLLTTVALYDITKQDVAQTNPEDLGPGDGRPEFLNLGEVESRGIEFTLVGDITERLTMTASYAYNQTEVVQGVEGDSIGNTFGDGSQFANAPEHQAGVWLRYSLPSLNSALAVGADYVSEQFSLSGQRVRPFTVYDTSWTTGWNQWEFQLNLRNLFDEEYFVSGFIERTGNFPGAPREIVAQVRYEF